VARGRGGGRKKKGGPAGQFLTVLPPDPRVTHVSVPIGQRRDSPIYTVKVRAPDGKGVRVDQSDRITSFKYEDEESKVDKIELVVDNFDLSLIDSPLWRKGNIIEASWGYPGLMAPTREAVIHKVVGAKQLKVEAYDKGILFHREHRIRTWDNVRRSDVARRVALEYGFEGERVFIQDTKVVQPHVCQARMTDAQLLRDMAKREGFDWYIDFDGFHFHERQLRQKPIRTFIYYSGPDAGDIIDWDIENDISAAKPGEVKAMGRDAITKQDFSYTANNKNTERTALAPVIDIVNREDGTTHSEPLAKTTATAAIHPSTEANAESAKRHADGAYKRAQLLAVKLTMTVWGDPRLVGKSVVSVERIGPTVSGNYYITSCHHDLDGSSYKCVLKLRRDGRNLATGTAFDELPGQGKGVKAAAATNAQKGGAASGGTAAVTPLESVDRESGRSSTVYRDTAGRQIAVSSGGVADVGAGMSRASSGVEDNQAGVSRTIP
jgi:phage protein D